MAPKGRCFVTGSRPAEVEEMVGQADRVPKAGENVGNEDDREDQTAHPRPGLDKLQVLVPAPYALK